MTEADWTTELRRSWATLEAAPETPIAVAAIGTTSGGLTLRVGYDQDGVRHLFVPTSDGDRPTVRRRDGAVTVAVNRISLDGVLTEVVDLACQGREFFDPFGELCGALLEEVAVADQPASATFKGVEQWRDLLRAHEIRRMNALAELGMFGELYVLRSIVAEGHAELGAWTGPAGGTQDFQFDAGWLEVKTRGQQDDQVHIHGLDQLDDSGGRTGFLIVIDVVEDGQGESTGDLIEQVDGALGSNETTRIASAHGWQPVEDPTRWSVSAVWVAPASSTPRITKAQIAGLDDRIDNVVYTIEMTAIREAAGSGPEAMAVAYRAASGS